MNVPFEALLFWTLAVVTIVPAVVVLFVKDIVRLAFWFLATLAGVAGIYLLLGADFLAFTQVLVYIGGILILILFGVMLTHRDPLFMKKGKKELFVPGVISGAIILALLVQVIGDTGWFSSPHEPKPTTAGIGYALLSDFVLPFEVASIVLLVALVGAANIARRRDAD